MVQNPALRRWLRLGLDVTTGGLIAAGAGVVGSILLGWSLTPRLVAAQAMMPAVLAGVALVTLTALVRRRWALTGAGAVVSLTSFGLVVPTVIATPEPAWAAEASQLTVYSSNLLRSNTTPDAALAVAAASDADVVILVEYVPAFEPALRRSGLLDRYPTVVRDDSYDRGLLLTRLPASDAEVVFHGGFEMPAASVHVGGRDVYVVGVHATSPTQLAYMRTWEHNLGGIADAVAGRNGAVVIGDFNSGIWNAPFQRLLDQGFVDAHESTGNGLARTWGRAVPGTSKPVALLGIDHAISRGDGLVPLSVVEHHVPGSDHEAIEVTYAVR